MKVKITNICYAGGYLKYIDDKGRVWFQDFVLNETSRLYENVWKMEDLPDEPSSGDPMNYREVRGSDGTVEVQL